MIERIIAFSAHNQYLVLLATAALAAIALAVHTLKVIRWTRCPTSPTRRSSSTRAGTGRPDIIEDQVTYPIVSALLGRAEGQGHPRLLRLRLLLRLRHLRGRHRPLLGAVPRPRVPVEDPAAAARGSADRAGARRHRRGLGLPVRAGRPVRAALPRRAALLPGLDAALRHPVRARRGRGGLDRRVRQKQYQVTVDPNRLAAYDIPLDAGGGGGAQLEQRGRRPAARVEPAPSTWCAAGATCGALEDFEKIVVEGRRPAACPSWCATWPGSRLGPEIRRGVADLDGEGDAVGGIVVMRHGENALNVIDAGQGAARGDRSRRCPRGSRSSPPTTAPT